MERGECSKNGEGEVAMEKLAKANATIDSLLDNNCFDIFNYKSPPSNEVKKSSAPFIPLEEVCTPRGQRVQVENTSIIRSVERRRRINEYPYTTCLSSPMRHILQEMPDPKQLEALLKLSVQFAEYHDEIGKLDDPVASNPLPPTEAWNVGHLIDTAMKLTASAEFVNSITPHYFNLAKECARMAPELLKGALAFQNLTKTFVPLFEERDAQIVQLKELQEELTRLNHVQATYKDLEQKLKTSEGTIKQLNEKSVRQTKEWKRMRDVIVELKTASKNSSDMAMTEVFVLEDSEDTQESEDKLGLPFDEGAEARYKVLEEKLKVSESNVEHLNQQLLRLSEELMRMRNVNAELKAASKIPNDVAISAVIKLGENEEIEETEDKLSLPFENNEATDNLATLNVEEGHEMSSLEVTPQPPMEKLSLDCVNVETQTKDRELEELKQKLEEANEAKLLIESEFNRLQLCLDLEKYMPSNGLESRWLAWVQKLQDRPSVVSRAMVGLQTLAMESIENCDAIERALNSFKTTFDEQPSKGYTEITCWGDMDAMFERLNHTKKDKETHINWILEAEEGWVPYNTLSAHIKDEDKKVVHACDPASPILKGSCSLCQGPFGPEGAITMGQCRHTFHVTCIVKAALVRSVCAECRCPLSARFYEMFGILEAMPPSHEYDRWTLPLDQGPFKFQSYLHWGKPLTWDSNERRHGLYEESGQPQDIDVWMTHNREVELRARGIVDNAARELFCRTMGGHWSLQHEKFFRFPEKKVERGPDDNWKEVNHGEEFDEQYGAYDHTLVGRALLLSKLEEAAKVRVVYDTDVQTSTQHSALDVAAAFDRRIGDIIGQWKAFLLDGDRLVTWQGKKDDEVVEAMVDRVESNLRALKANEVDLSPKRKQKRKREDDDDFSPETKKQLAKVDAEVQSGGRMLRPSQQRSTRRRTAELFGTTSFPHQEGEGSGPSNGK